jgi:hypothetical protein
MSDPKEPLLLDSVTSVLALKNMVAVLLAMQVMAHPNGDELLKTISEGLDAKLDGLPIEDRHVMHNEKIRAEQDWILRTTRKLAGLK